jgi:uncharacterized membrane protein (DUF106 family)
MTDPDKQKAVYDALYGQINAGFGSYIRDVKDSWKILLIMAFVTLFITLVYIWLLRCFTKPILYGSLLLILVFLALCCYYTYDNTLQYANEKES